MRNVLVILILICAGTCNAMKQDPPNKPDEVKKSIDADTQKPQTLKTYKEKPEDYADDHDEWAEFDENTESLSPRKLSRFRTNPTVSQSASVHHYNLVQSLKENPDAFSYDSDEIPEVIAHLESKTPAKN